MRSWGDSGVFLALLVAALIVVYFLPAIIGLIRSVERLGLVFLVNLLGWIGWPAAVILAFGPRRRLPPPPPTPIYPPPVVPYSPQVPVLDPRSISDQLASWRLGAVRVASAASLTKHARHTCEPSNATFVIDKLKKQGLIERCPHSTGRSATQLVHTA